MDIILWIIAGLLAFAFLAGGVVKLARPPAKLAASGMGWAEDFSPAAVKAIGLAEVLAGLGLILPALVGVAPALVAWAAVGVAALMLGAAIVHLRRGEVAPVAVNVLILALAVGVAWGRFGPYAG